MYCRNCGNEVNEKAVACPKCGFNPRSEKKFCPSCGVETDPKQVACIKCGVSLENKSFNFDTGSLPKFDIQGFFKDKPRLFATIALFCCFMPWLSLHFYYNDSVSLFGISKLSKYVDGTILISLLVNLFPLSLLAFILSDYIAQIKQYKKIFSLGSLVLLVYITLGVILAINHSTPEIPDTSGLLGADAGKIANDAMNTVKDAVKSMITFSFGFYLSAITSVASFVLFMKQKN